MRVIKRITVNIPKPVLHFYVPKRFIKRMKEGMNMTASDFLRIAKLSKKAMLNISFEPLSLAEWELALFERERIVSVAWTRRTDRKLRNRCAY